VFFTASAVSNRYEEIGIFYDKLYDTTKDTWNQLAARGTEFVEFVASLVMQNRPTRYLDVGCGEGHILAAVRVEDTHGLDLSRRALQVASVSSGAHLCLGYAEQLPYPNDYFDAISSIGVMTHLIEDLDATKEIHRVLNKDGVYIVGVYVPPRLPERIIAKAIEFIYPRPRPLIFLRWTIKRVSKALQVGQTGQGDAPDKQPVGRYYTAKQVELLFKRAGFVIQELITKIKRPSAPLAGQHFRIYVLRKKHDQSPHRCSMV